MTGSWDKKLKYWDTRQPNPVLSHDLPERCYCADVVGIVYVILINAQLMMSQDYPLSIVCTANRGIVIYNLENTPTEFKVSNCVCNCVCNLVS